MVIGGGVGGTYAMYDNIGKKKTLPQELEVYHLVSQELKLIQ